MSRGYIFAASAGTLFFARQLIRQKCGLCWQGSFLLATLTFQKCFWCSRSYEFHSKISGFITLNPRIGSTRGRGGEIRVRVRVFLIFFSLDDKTYSAPEDFSSCLFIPRTHFETSLVMVSYYGYEI